MTSLKTNPKLFYHFLHSYTRTLSLIDLKKSKALSSVGLFVNGDFVNGDFGIGDFDHLPCCYIGIKIGRALLRVMLYFATSILVRTIIVEIILQF